MQTRQNVIGQCQYEAVLPSNVDHEPMIVRPGYCSINYSNYGYKRSLCSGVSLIVIGFVSIALQIAKLALRSNVAILGHGMWSGVLCIITGVFGIGTSRSRLAYKMGYMVLAIITATLAVNVFYVAFMTSTGACHYYTNEGYTVYSTSCSASTFVEACLACSAALAFIFAVYGSSLGCRVICCCSTSPPRLEIRSYGNAVPAVPLQSSDITLTFQEPRHQSDAVIVCDPEPSAPPAYIDLQYLQPPTYDDIVSTQDKK